MPEKKERATQIERAHFTFDTGVLCNGEVSELFQKTLNNLMPTPKTQPQMFRKVAKIYKPITLELSVSPIISSVNPIRPIDIPDFAKKALQAISDYRVISTKGSRRELGTYMFEEHDPHDEGTYVWARDGEPMFGIDIGDKGPYITGPMAFKELDGIGILQYAPNLDASPKYVLIETTVAKRAKGGREQLTKRLFLDFHRKLTQEHSDRDMTPA